MNDPQVETLIYRVRHHESVDYSNVEPLSYDHDDFRVDVKDEEARFELKHHFATEQEARQAVDPFIRDWEFDACLRGGPGCFELEFIGSVIVDRQPIAGKVEVSLFPSRFEFRVSKVSGTTYPPSYPLPPSDVDSSHLDVRTLIERYKGYRRGREELPGFAYFCLTVLEYPFAKTRPRKGSGGRRQQAARHYGVDKAVLDRIGKLSSTKGGIAGARKSEGVAAPLTDEERRFLERASVRLIRRVAERGATGGDLPPISMGGVSE